MPVCNVSDKTGNAAIILIYTFRKGTGYLHYSGLRAEQSPAPTVMRMLIAITYSFDFFEICGNVPYIRFESFAGFRVPGGVRPYRNEYTDRNHILDRFIPPDNKKCFSHLIANVTYP